MQINTAINNPKLLQYGYLLMSDVKKSLTYSVFTQFLSKILDFSSVVIFARLLTPSELGVLAIASSVAFIASEFRLLGTNNYIVREKEISQNVIRNCIGLALLISWLLGLITMGLAIPAANFYETPDLEILLCILAVSFFFTPFTSTTAAVLTRSMRFGHLAFLQLVGKSFGLLVSVYLVSNEYSYFGIVIGMSVAVIVDCFVARLLKPADMRWTPKFSGIHSIIGFGLINSLINLLRRMETTVQDIIVGKIGTPRDVALISRGIGLHVFVSEFLLNGIRSVAMPYLSDANRRGSDIKGAYYMAMNLLLAFALPPILVAGIAAESLVLLLFGEQWRAAVPIAESLSIWMGIKLLSNFAFPTLIVLRAEKGLLMIQSMLIASLVLLITIIYPLGLEYVHIPFILCASLEFLLTSALLKKHIGFSFLNFLFSIYKVFIISVVCVSIAWFLRHFLSDGVSDGLMVIIYAAILFPIWVLVVYCTKHPLKTEINNVAHKIRVRITKT